VNHVNVAESNGCNDVIGITRQECDSNNQLVTVFRGVARLEFGNEGKSTEVAELSLHQVVRSLLSDLRSDMRARDLPNVQFDHVVQWILEH
jgi:hypothetical protein